MKYKIKSTVRLLCPTCYTHITVQSKTVGFYLEGVRNPSNDVHFLKKCTYGYTVA